MSEVPGVELPVVEVELPVATELPSNITAIKIEDILIDYLDKYLKDLTYAFSVGETTYKINTTNYFQINGKYYNLQAARYGILLSKGTVTNDNNTSGCGFIYIINTWHMFNSKKTLCTLFDLNKNDIYRTYDIFTNKLVLHVSEYKCEEVISDINDGDRPYEYEPDNELKALIPVGSNGVFKIIIKYIIKLLYKIYKW